MDVMTQLNKEYNLNLPRQRLSIIPARFQKRALALLIDFLILQLVAFSTLFSSLNKYLTGSLLDGSFMTSFNAIPEGLLLILISGLSIITLLYFSLFDYYLQGSPGKLFVGVRVSTPSLLSAFIRNLSSIFIFPFNWIFVLDMYYLLKYKYRWSEKFSGSFSYEVLKY